jgi:hypothetical protein
MGIAFITPAAAFDLARRVLRAGTYDEEAVEAALDVLSASTDADDQRAVAMLRGPSVRPDMAQADDVPRLTWPLAAIAVAAGCIGPGLEWAGWL